jgi:hypothetical protein
VVNNDLVIALMCATEDGEAVRVDVDESGEFPGVEYISTEH